MKHLNAIIASMLLISLSLGGCLKENEEKNQNDEIDEILNPQNDLLFEECIPYDSLARCWITLLPPNYTSNESYPLVVDMHGYTGTNYGHYNYSEFQKKIM
jgi:hypothetical protein